MEKFLIVMFYMGGASSLLSSLLMFSKSFRETTIGQMLFFSYQMNKLWKHMFSLKQISIFTLVIIIMQVGTYYLIDYYFSANLAYHFTIANVLSGVALIIGFNHPAVTTVVTE